jgi:hypothetical protein
MNYPINEHTPQVLDKARSAPKYPDDPYIGDITKDRVPNMDGYAGRGTIAFMRPGVPRSALRPIGDPGIPYMEGEFAERHEAIHHRRHARNQPQNEAGEHCVNDTTAYEMKLPRRPSAIFY